jgi:chromosome segregation ATPase
MQASGIVSSLGSKAKSDQNALYQAKNQLQQILNQMDQVAKEGNVPPDQVADLKNQVAAWRTELEKQENDATRGAHGGTMGQGGVSEYGMPTGVSIQGRRRVRQ